MSKIEVLGAEIENLRGFTSTYIDLERKNTILLGPNNEGKSSLLLLMDFLLNTVAKDSKLANSDRELTDEEYALIVPANNERHRARRFTLYLSIKDKRTHNKYCDSSSGPVLLRMSFQKSNSRIRINYGRPQRSEPVADQKSYELLKKVAKEVKFHLIPAARDADAHRFQNALKNNLDNYLLKYMEHTSGQGGTTTEYRQTNEILSKIDTLVNQATTPFWEGVKPNLPAGMARKIDVSFLYDSEALRKWIESQIHLRITTGDHDSSMVDPANVGNGLQSLLDVAMTLSSETSKNKGLFYLAIEEPEAFLHPRAQREIFNIFRQKIIENKNMRLLVTTHSPIIVDESH